MRIDKNIRVFTIAGLILLFITFIFPFFIQLFYPKLSDRAILGDSYGSLNALFSGLAFAGIITTIIMQRKELQYQRKELAMQREEMKQTREEFTNNRITSIIYNQLERYEVVINGLTAQDDLYSTFYKGNSAFLYIHQLFKELKYEKNTDNMGFNHIDRAFDYIIHNQENILNFSVVASNVTDVVKETLINSHLNYDELNLMKGLFFRNLGYIHLEVLKAIVDIIQFKKEHSERHNKVLDTHRTLDIFKYLKNVTNFKDVYFHEDDIHHISDDIQNDLMDKM